MSTPPPVTWEVTGVAPYTDLDSNGNPVQGYRVNYQLSTGPTDSVFIRGMTFDPAVARDMIAANAAILHQVNSLKGTVGP